MTVSTTSEKQKEANNPRRRLSLAALGAAIALALSLYQVLRVFQMAFFEGGNSLSTDYIALVPLVDRMLSGSYQWSHLLTDSCVGSHYMLLSLLSFAANAALFHWNVRVDIGFGLVLAIARTWLLFDCLTSKNDGVKRWYMLAALLALNFGSTESSMLLYGELAVALGLTLFGFVLGLWGLLKFAGKPLGAVAMTVGGVVSAISWGNVLPCWITYFLALVARRSKKISSYAALAVALFVSLAPYLWLFPHDGHKMGADRTRMVSLVNGRFFLNCLGRPLANKIATTAGSLPMAEWSSIIGLVLLCLLSALTVWTCRARGKSEDGGYEQFVPAYLLIVYGLASIWFIGVFRWTMAPWYVPLAMPFWIGLMTIAYRLIVVAPSLSTARSRGSIIGAAVSVLTVAVLYAITNIKYHEQNLYIHTRTPASESALRHFDSAPTYCESLVFEWGGGHPSYMRDLGVPLKKNGWSCFAPQEEWTLQGDYALANTSVKGDPGDLFWSKDSTERNRRSWDSQEHLNMVLSGPVVVEWNVDLPANCRNPVFRTATAAAGGASNTKASAMVAIEGKGIREHQIVFADARWKALTMPLNQYRGQKVRIVFSLPAAPASTSLASAAFQYPRIDLDVDSPAASASTELANPSNTDISPLFPATTSGDLVLDTADKNSWDHFHASEQSKTSAGTTRSGLVWTPQLSYEAIAYALPIKVSLADYAYLRVEVSANDAVTPRQLTAQIKTDQDESRLIFVPLLTDAGKHAYTYDLKLLDLKKGSNITSISFIAPEVPKKVTTSKFVVDAASFIRRSKP